jgi:hypothetical protein
MLIAAMPRYIRVIPYGAYANQAFQHMLAMVIQHRVADSKIVGSYMPYWGIDYRSDKRVVAGFSMDIRSHVFPFEATIETLKSVGDAELVIRCVASRMAYFERYKALFLNQFVAKGMDEKGYGPEYLVISVRLGEIIQGKFPYYGPLPISWYRELIAETGLKPVFFGQIGDDLYSIALRKAFPQAEFVPSRGAMPDFHILRTSRNVALSISTFAWIAAWLSETAANIFMPLYLMFNPAGRPDVDLVPINDSRYKFYQFPDSKWGSSDEEFRALFDRPSSAVSVSAEAILERYPTTGTDGCAIQHPHVLVASEN